MDGMSEDGAMPQTATDAQASPGEMRVVMLNARTAVLVPVGDLVPTDAVGNEAVSDGAWGDDADLAQQPDRADPHGKASLDTPSPGGSEGFGDGAVDRTDIGDLGAGDDLVLMDVPSEDEMPHDDAFVEDPLPGDEPSGFEPLERDGSAAEAPHAADAESAEADLPEITLSSANASDGWKAELLARLDDLGRLLSSAPTADGGSAALGGAISRLEARLDDALAQFADRIAQLEAAQSTPAMTAAGDSLEGGATDPAAPDATRADSLAEAVAELRMQLRMVEVQVGTLGKLLVSGPEGEATPTEALRIWLAERMATEQRLASGI